MKGISSVYGFILIFLLSMASIQTWSSAVSSLDGIQSASDQSHQVEQLQGLERLSLLQSGGNLTITNVGQVPSTILYLRWVGANSSRTAGLDARVAVGASLREDVPPAGVVEVVTSLGNVFSTQGSSDPPGSVWSIPAGTVGAGDAQLFEDQYDPSLFYLSSGAQVYAFSPSGAPLWSFDAAVGTVTDVMPIAGGDVYVSVGYSSTSSNAAELYELSSNGRLIASFPVRLLAASSSLTESEFGPGGPFLQPVAKGSDSDYAFYDGWFFSARGPVGSIAGDSALLAASDSSQFYLYTTGEHYFENGCEPVGNAIAFDSYTPNAASPEGVELNWETTVFLTECNSFPEQLVSAGVGGGAVASLFSEPYFSPSANVSYSGQNPYVVVLSDSGRIEFQGAAPCAACTSIATDGADVYLAVPTAQEIQVIHTATGSVSTYPIGIAASSLLWRNGTLFAISDGAIETYSDSMVLEKTVSLAPLGLASYRNSLTSEPALQAPSLVVLNGTTCAVLAENATGRVTAVLWRYR